jgi:ATP-dependent exoDNAse (exonuclease V) beta subunit
MSFELDLLPRVDDWKALQVPDVKYYSVSAFLQATVDEEKKQALERWRQRVGDAEAEKISRQAQTRGHGLHAIAEQYFLGNENWKQDASMLNLMKFGELKDQMDKNITKVYGCEMKLVSHVLQIRGIADLLCDWDGKFAVCDFKTSTNHKTRNMVKDYFIQTSLYAMMVYEMFGRMPETMVLPIFVTHDVSVVYTAPTSEYLSDLKGRINVWRSQTR